jgi:hypothetical protein
MHRMLHQVYGSGGSPSTRVTAAVALTPAITVIR